jgi:hypothetical protein
MFTHSVVRTLLLLTLVAAVCVSAHAELDAVVIGDAAGAKATTTSDGVVRVTYPRNEIGVTVNGKPLRPFAGLTSWAAFTGSPEHAMLMGDTVVFEDEINPAIDAAFAAGLEVTALHNHFLYDSPRVFFMHIGGMGSVVDLARGVHQVWDAVKAVRAQYPTVTANLPGVSTEIGMVVAAPLEEILGVKSTQDSGMVKFTIGRDATMHGIPVGGSMGLTTWAAFAGSDSAAFIDGDVMMAPDEIQSVLRALRKANIYIVALHNHMIGEEPSFYFVHFWGEGDAQGLAQGFKSVLAAQKMAASTEH